jgi:hypothetical protein
MIEGLIGLIIVILIVCFIAGLVIFLIRRAPFIPGEFKVWLEYGTIAVAVLYIILRTLPLLGVSI